MGSSFAGRGMAGMLWFVVLASSGLAQSTIQIDIQSDNADAYHGAGAENRTPGVWNHVTGTVRSGLRDAGGNVTPVRLDLNGFEDRFKTSWTEHDLLRDFVFKRGTQYANAILSGLDPSRRYDLYLYPSPDGARFRVAGVEQQLVFAGTGVGGDAAYGNGAPFARGKNFVSFHNVTPNSAGRIVVEFAEEPTGPSNAGGLAGLTLVLPEAIHLDRQLGNGAAYAGPGIGSAAGAAWNHVTADTTAGLFNDSGQRTTVGLSLFGASGRFQTGWTSHPLMQDFLFRSAGAPAIARITGLGAGERFDLYLHPGPDGARFIVNGTTLDLDFQGTGPGGDPDYGDGAPWIEGRNYVVFRNVPASATGELLVQYGVSPTSASANGSLAGFSLVSLSGNLIVHADIQAGADPKPWHGPAASVPASQAPIWNASGADQVAGLVNASGRSTSVSLQLQHASGAFQTTWTTHPLFQDFLFRNTAGNAEGVISGLDPNLAYNLYLLPSPDGARFTVGSDFGDAVFQGSGPGGDPDYAPGALFKHGVNVAAFHALQPDANGSIRFQYGDSPANTRTVGGFAGFMLTHAPTNSLPPAVLPGIADGLVTFNGVSDHHEIPHTPAQLSTSFTLETWVRTSQSGLGRILTKRSDDGNLQQFSLYLDGGRIAVRFDPESLDGAVALTGGSQVADDKWHHVAAVFDDIENRLRLYVDGRLDGAAVVTKAPITTSQPLTLGRFSAQFGQYFDGQLDETRIWNVARTAQELARQRHVRLRSAAPGLVWASGMGRPVPVRSGAPSSGRVFSSIGEYRVTIFDTRQFAQIPNEPEFNTASFAVESWVKVSPLNNVMRIVTKPKDDGTTQRYSLLVNGGKPEIRFDSFSSGPVVAQGGTMINDGQWHHLAGVFEHRFLPALSELRMYVDGRLETVVPTRLSPGSSLAPLEFGRFNAAVGQHFIGKFDELRVWNRARSTPEIQASYWRPLTGSESGLVGYYRLDDLQTNSLFNSSPFNFSGTSSLVRETAGTDPLPDPFSRAVPIQDIVVMDEPSKAVNNGNSPWQAIDGDPQTGLPLSPGITTNPQLIVLDLGQRGRVVNRLRLAKQGDNDSDGQPDRMDLEILFTTDQGLMALRNFHPVRGLTSGIGGREPLQQGQVSENGVIADAHDFATHGFYSLSFYEVNATAIAIRVRRNAADSRRWTHLALLEAELYHEAEGVPVELQKALGFDGVNDYVAINHAPSLNTSGFSVEAWVRTTQSGLARIVTKPAGGRQRYSLLLDATGTGRPVFGFDAVNGAGAQFVTGASSVNDGRWHHLAGVYDPVGGTLRIYVDGSLSASKQANGIPIASLEPVQIGRFNQAFGQYFQGAIDEVRIWGRALSSAEVQTSYRAILTGREPGLVALLGFNEGSGDVAGDASPLNNRGMLFNSPVWLDSDNELDLRPRSQVEIARLLTGSLERLETPLRVTGIQDAALTLDDWNEATLVSTNGRLTWLDIPFRVTRAGVDRGRQRLDLRVEFRLFGIKNAFGQPITYAVELEVNPAGEVAFAGGRFEIPAAPAGRLPKIGKFMSLGNLYFEYFPAQKIIGGGMEIGFWNKLRRSPNCPTFSGAVPRIGAAFQLRGDKLNSLVINLNDLNQPVGAAAFLNTIQGGANNLIDPDRTIYSFATVFNFGCPIELPLKTISPASFTGTVRVRPSGYAELAGQGKLFDVAMPEAFGRYSWGQHDAFSLGMRGHFLIYRNAEAKVTVNNSGVSGSIKGTMLTPSDIKLTGFSPSGGGFAGDSIPDVKATITEQGLRGSFQLLSKNSVKNCRKHSERLCKSKVVTFFASIIDRIAGALSKRRVNSYRTVTDTICNTVVKTLSTKIAFRIAPDGSTSFGRQTSSLTAAAWESGFQKSSYDQRTGLRTTFMTNWRRKDRATTGLLGSVFGRSPAGMPQTFFDITTNDVAVIFRLSYQNPTVTQPELVVIRPDGVTLHVNDGFLPDGFADGSGFSEILVGEREASIFLERPMPGQYEVLVGNAQELQNYAVELLTVIPEPEIEIIALGNTGTEGVVSVHVAADVGTNVAALKFYLVEDDDPDAGGYCLSTNVLTSGTNSFSVDLRNLDVLSGDYLVMAQVDDGFNDLIHAFSADEIEVEDENAPAAVQGLASRAGNASFTVRWQPSANTNISHYEIVFTKANDPGDDFLSTAVPADQDEASVTGLDNGHPYLVTVVAVTTDGIASRIEEIHRVIPSRGFGLNPPIFVTQPDEETTAGFLYFYAPQIFDADFTQSAVAEASGFATNAGTAVELNNQWTLEQGPAGMSIEPDSGIITWTPSAAQVGDHLVTLSVTEPFLTNQVGSEVMSEFAARQSFVLSVYPTNNLHGLNVHNHQFLSQPDLVVAEDTRFEYPVHVLGANATDYTLQVVEGPAAMNVGVVSNEYLVTWDVPAGARGTFVGLRASFADGIDIEQEFFLHVQTASNRLPNPTAIAAAGVVDGRVILNWSGDGPFYQLQRRPGLTSGEWIDVGPVLSADRINGIADESPAGSQGFYRIQTLDSSP